MYSERQRHTFIKRRADGYSLATISDLMDIPKSTLWVWDKEEQQRIHHLRLLSQDRLAHDYCQTREDRLKGYYEVLRELGDSFLERAKTTARCASLKEHLQLIKDLRAEVEKLELKPPEAGPGEPSPAFDPATADIDMEVMLWDEEEEQERNARHKAYLAAKAQKEQANPNPLGSPAQTPPPVLPPDRPNLN